MYIDVKRRIEKNHDTEMPTFGQILRISSNEGNIRYMAKK